MMRKEEGCHSWPLRNSTRQIVNVSGGLWRGWGYDEERGGVSFMAIKKQYKANSKRERGGG